MCTIKIEVPEEFLHDKKISPDEKGKFLLKEAALELYKKGGASHGYCAQVAGLSRWEFIQFLGEHKISIYDYYTEEELLQDMEVARAGAL